MAKDTQAGRYTGRGAGVPVVGSSGGPAGTPQIGIMVELIDEHGGVFDTLHVYWSLHGGAGPITTKSMRTLGWTGKELGDWSGFGSTDVAVVVKYQEWNGKMQQKVDVWPLDGGSVQMAKPLEGRELAALNAKLKGVFLQTAPTATATDSGGPPAWARPAAAVAAAPQDLTPPAGEYASEGAAADDIPF